ncbi:helix-turn-helix domain-containing protein [Paenibacillus psychroresistens]|uniref:Helix-turn-helix domain-containing protein n=1 Tax=Paenibacillus psychroresistens TaxID=1778678 RepID=A0A6B8RS66_9BACL|nr:helix-turn-helix domain-containing protein [Paenibacillus psychroresistens]QGQ98737.1 helix-turn-helix domain-containing protein [Paenibacillus psychroresistens]
MFRLMIVDNEPNIVRGLKQLLVEESSLELEVYCAHSADEALLLLNRVKIDIALSDIRMPGMNGLELQARIIEQWPQCKVIFLSGYDDFNYIQTAIRNGSVDYILKTDGDEVILQAIQKAMTELSRESEIDNLHEQTQSKLQQSLVTLQKDYFHKLVYGLNSVKQHRLDELKIQFDAKLPLLLIIARVDRWDPSISDADKALLYYAVQNITEEFLKDFNYFGMTLDHRSLLSCLQENPASQWGSTPNKWIRYVHSQLESIQSACQKYLKLPVSFVASSTTIDWNGIPVKYAELRQILFYGFGQREEMILTDEVTRNFQEGTVKSELELKAQSKLKQLLSSDLIMEHRLLNDFEELVELTRQLKHNNPFLHETYNGISYMLLAYINQHQKWSQLALTEDLNKLFSLDAHLSWEQAVVYLKELILLLLEDRNKESEEGAEFLVTKLKAYIDRHLDEELSLVRLAEIVYLNPTYLSRLFKQHTGQGISHYITQLRLIKSQELLKHSKLKVQEIAVKAGFDSATSFGRFFKRETNLTPQEYRDNG